MRPDDARIKSMLRDASAHADGGCQSCATWVRALKWVLTGDPEGKVEGATR